MIRFDAEAFRRLNNLAGKYPILDAVGGFCARWLIMLMFGLVVLRAAVATRRPETRLFGIALDTAALRAFAAAALAFSGNWLFSLLVFRPRPYVALRDVNLLIPEPITSHAFPSGHSSVAFALAFSVLFVDLPFGLLLLAMAAGVAFGRVYAGVHYPGDVVVGIVVGLFWSLVVHGLGSRFHDVDLVKRFLIPKRDA